MGRYFQDRQNIKASEVLNALNIKPNQIHDLNAIRNGLTKLDEDTQRILENYGIGAERDDIMSPIAPLIEDTMQFNSKKPKGSEKVLDDLIKEGTFEAYTISTRLQLTELSKVKPLDVGQNITLRYEGGAGCVDVPFITKQGPKGLQMDERKVTPALWGFHDSEATSAAILRPQECKP